MHLTVLYNAVYDLQKHRNYTNNIHQKQIAFIGNKFFFNLYNYLLKIP